MDINEQLRRVALWRALRRRDEAAANALTSDLSHDEVHAMLHDLAVVDRELDTPDELLDFTLWLLQQQLVAELRHASREVR